MTNAPDSLFLDLQESLAGRYSLVREIGRGGMGIVYLAHEVHLDRPVAIKLLPPEHAMEDALRERFLREARLAAKLSHPNIIPIHAVEQVGGFVFYVMSFVDGETLAQRVRARGPLTSADGANLMREAAWALAYAHSQGLVHRDVKPDNILLEGASGRVLVADFGIAAAFTDAVDDGIAGTPEFMSPEQALGDPLDARSDLYSLGCTAYFAFSGRCPFEGKTQTEVLAKQVTEPAPPLASLGVIVPRKLGALIERCLAKDRTQRPESAQVLAEQLATAIEVRREVPAALRAFVKRHARLDGSGTLVLGIFLLPVSVLASLIGGPVAGYATLFLGATVPPATYFTVVARRLLKLGFAHQDLAPAYAAELERAREEIVLERRPTPPSFVERSLAPFSRITAAGTLVGLGAAIGLGPATQYWIGPLLVAGVSLSTFSGIAALFLAQRRRDVETEFWSKVWLGRLGKGLFAMARRFVGSSVPQSAMTHRATELSLGLAAEQLFDALPKATRTALGDLPGILKRLQEDAQALRRRYDDLQEALADAGEAAASPAYADVRASRDELHAKLGDAVSALETIRLNLLRLHAGSTTVQSLTTHLGIAAEVSAQVERLVAAHEEVERGLRFPRAIASTPV